MSKFHHFQSVIVYFKSGEVGFCTLEYFDFHDLQFQVNNLSMCDDVDIVELDFSGVKNG